MWSQHRLPQQASFLVVVMWGQPVRELGTLRCKAEQLRCQGQAAQLAFRPSLARGGEEAAMGIQVAACLSPCELNSCGQLELATGAWALSPGELDEV